MPFLQEAILWAHSFVTVLCLLIVAPVCWSFYDVPIPIAAHGPCPAQLPSWHRTVIGEKGDASYQRCIPAGIETTVSALVPRPRAGTVLCVPRTAHSVPGSSNFPSRFYPQSRELNTWGGDTSRDVTARPLKGTAALHNLALGITVQVIPAMC